MARIDGVHASMAFVMTMRLSGQTLKPYETMQRRCNPALRERCVYALKQRYNNATYRCYVADRTAQQRCNGAVILTLCEAF